MNYLTNNLIAKCSLVIGSFLICLNVAGFFVKPVENDIRNYAHPVAGYNYRTMNPDDAIDKYVQLKENTYSQDEKARALFDLVAKSFIHSDIYKTKPWDNWLRWIVGVVYTPYSVETRGPNILWVRGGGFCDQAAVVYASKAKELGLDAGVIDLNGHVVAEVKMSKGWRVVDTDLDIFWDYGLKDFGKSLSEQQIINVIKNRGLSTEEANKAARIYVSQKDNIEYPNISSDIRLAFLFATKYLKWIIPAMLILYSFLKKYNFY